MPFELHHGDCVDVMRSMPPGCVDAIVTSPPYAEQRKSTYGGIPESEYPAWTVAWMTEAWRVLKPNGSVIINISPHIKNGTVAEYVLRTRLAVREAGWVELQELIWHKSNGMPTGAASRPRRSFEHLMWFGKHGRAWSDARSAGKPTTRPTAAHKDGRAHRFGWDHSKGGNKGTTPTAARVPDVVTLPSSDGKQNGVDHPAMFPVALAEWCGKLICPTGGTIMDPFSGSGSTGIAAIRNDWDYIGIDAVKEYVDMSRERLEGEAA